MREYNYKLVDIIDKDKSKMYILTDKYILELILNKSLLLKHNGDNTVNGIILECLRKELSLESIKFIEGNSGDTISLNADRLSFQEICEYMVNLMLERRC